MRSFYERDLPIDNLIVAEELKRLDALSAAGGISFIMTCCNSLESAQTSMSISVSFKTGRFYARL